MNVVRMLIGIFLICFVCSCVSAQDIVKSNADVAEAKEEPLVEELLNEYEALEEEVVVEEVADETATEGQDTATKAVEEKAQQEPAEKEEKKLDIGKIDKVVLKEGTALDDKTYAKIVQYRRDAEISNLQITAVRMASTKANDGYWNTLKIWLALHGVKEPDFYKWELRGKRVYLKKKK
jgi:hypothetical protein